MIKVYRIEKNGKVSLEEQEAYLLPIDSTVRAFQLETDLIVEINGEFMTEVENVKV